MTIKTLALAALLAALTATSSLAATVTFNVVGGQPLGASNVEVNGKLFDVKFVDGTCVALFGGCDAPSDFVFSTADQAAAPAQSLSDTVFLDGPLGNFDSDPALTAGIEAAFFDTAGYLQSPFKLAPFGTNRVFAAVFINGSDTANGTKDRISTGFTITILGDLSQIDSAAYARFTASQIAAVSLPAGAMLLLKARAALGALQARRKTTAIS